MSRYKQLMAAGGLQMHHARTHARTHAHTHTHTFNGPFSGTTRVSQYQKGKTNLDFTEARDSEWQWHQLGHMCVLVACRTGSPRTSQTTVAFCRMLAIAHCGPIPMTCGSCLCHEHITNSVIGVSRALVLDCGMTFHLDSGGRDLPWTLSENL